MTTFANAADAHRFIRGGRAIVTIRSKKSGEHRTYRVSRPAEDKPFFVGLLAGSDNTSDYVYAGIMDPATGAMRTTAKSQFTCDSVPVRAWNYVAKHLAAGQLPADAEVMHEGRCCVCGRVLTVPESIERGIGPECYSKMGG